MNLFRIKRLAYLTVLSLAFCDLAFGQAAPFNQEMPDDGTPVGGVNPSNDFVPLEFNAAGELLVNGTVMPSSTGVTPVVSAAAETGHVIKAAPGILWGFEVTNGATAGYVLVHDSATVPAAGAVTPIKCYLLPANNTIGVDFRSGPAPSFATGISISFSSTGCFTQTDSATAFISGEAG